MKTVAYVRISSTEQDLKRQIEDIKKFAISKNFELVKTFRDTISASKTVIKEREGFVEMDKYLLVNKDIKNILVIEVSRLGRKHLEILNTIEKYYQRGINIHVKDLNLSTLDSQGEKSYLANMVISLLGSMAENESRLLGERIRSGKLERARQGFSFNAKATGYKKDSDGRPIIDEDEAPIVRRIFELASKSIGMRSISEVIKDEFGRDFPMGTIGGILRNSFYKGERTNKNKNIKLESIVSKELWKAANDSVDSRKHYASRQYVHPNLVQGKIYCKRCNCVMHQVVILSARSNFYRCKNKSCSNSINRPWLQEVIKQVMDEFGKRTKDKIVREQIHDEIKVIGSRLRNIKKDLRAKNTATTTITVKFAEGKLTDANYSSALDKISNDITKLEKEKEILKNQEFSYRVSLENEIKHFSDDLNVLKKQIKDILIYVNVFKDEVEIRLPYSCINLQKPKSGKLGWLTRRAKNDKEKDYGDLLVDSYLISAEDLERIEYGINAMSFTEEDLDNYFNSEEYKMKSKGLKGLGKSNLNNY